MTASCSYFILAWYVCSVVFHIVPVKPQLHQRFLACDGDDFFENFMLPVCGENRMCSHPRTGETTAEKIAEKNHEKFSELNFLQQNHGLCRQV